MYKRILVATDGSSLSKKAVTHAIGLAAVSGAELIAFKAVPRYPTAYFEGAVTFHVDDIARAEKQGADAAQTLVDGVRTQAEAQGVKARGAIGKSDLVAE